ncbi:MAG TPA: hypothetical protein VF006_22620 [Longimicrobium sp.]
MGLVKVSLVLDSIAYSGDSVGRDWTFQIKGSAGGDGFQTEYRSAVGPGQTVMPGTVIKEFYVDETDPMTVGLDVAATERDKKYSDSGSGSVGLGGTTGGTVSISVKENEGPNVKSTRVANLGLHFRMATSPDQSFCPPNIPADLPRIDVVKDLPDQAGNSTRAGGTYIATEAFDLRLCPYQENREWKAKVSAATARIRWNVYPNRFQEPVFPPAAGANVSCGNINSVLTYLYLAYQSGCPTVDESNPGVRPFYTLAAAEAHEMSHIADGKTYITNVFAAVQDRLSREVLGTALGTSLDEVKARLQTLANQALADWKSGTEKLREINESANEQKASDAGKPFIKPALDLAVAYASQKCGLNVNLPT